MGRKKLGSHKEEDGTLIQEKQVTTHQGGEFICTFKKDQVFVYNVRIFDFQTLVKVFLSVMIRESAKLNSSSEFNYLMVKSRLKWQVQSTVSSSVLFSLLVSDSIITLSQDRKL